MSETKRASLTTLSTNKCEKKPVKAPKKTVRLEINLKEPNEDESAVFNFTALINSLEKKLKKKNPPEGKLNGNADPFAEDDDEEVERIARQFEEKYGGGDGNRCDLYSELGAGYDENDPFIDNTEACEEALPDEYQTVHGGYYVHSGPLHLKRVELCDVSESDRIQPKRRRGGPNVIEDDSEEDEEEEDDDEEEDDEDEEDEDDEEECETTEKETDVSEKNEEKPSEKEVDNLVTVKKMKLEKTEECEELATKSEEADESPLLHKKRKKAEKKHHNHHHHEADRNNHHHKHHKHHRKDEKDDKQALSTPALNNNNSDCTAINSDIISVSVASSLVTNSAVDAASHLAGHQATPISNGGHVAARGPMDDVKSSEKQMKKKKKSATVKALLEEKRLQSMEPAVAASRQNDSPSNLGADPVAHGKNHKSVNDVIEFVISSARDDESSKDSSCSSTKSNSDSDASGSSHGSTDDQVARQEEATPQAIASTPMAKPPPAEAPPFPDSLPAEMTDLISRVKVAATSSQFSKRNFSPEVNIMLMNLEMKMQNISSVSRALMYEHLAFVLPCSKQTLIKKMKKMCYDFEESKMTEPLNKLKAAVDSAMPALLMKYYKDCKKITAEKSVDGLPGADANTDESLNPKAPRRKFVWTNEMRAYVRELIRLRMVCYHIKNPRRETGDVFLKTFLDSRVQPLWPVGWMKTSILIREAESNTAQTLRKVRKQPPSQQQQLQQLQQQQQQQQQQQLHHQQLQAQMQSIITQQLQQQSPQPLQSLLNVSLPSSTTLTPTNGGATSSFKLQPDHHLQALQQQQQQQERKSKKSSPLSISTTSSPSSAVSVISPTNGLTISRVNPPSSPHLATGSVSPANQEPKVLPSPSPPKRQSSASPNSSSGNTSPFSIKSITLNGSSLPYRDFVPTSGAAVSNNNNSSGSMKKPGKMGGNSGKYDDKNMSNHRHNSSGNTSAADNDNSILDLSSNCNSSRTDNVTTQKSLKNVGNSSNGSLPSSVSNSGSYVSSLVNDRTSQSSVVTTGLSVTTLPTSVMTSALSVTTSSLNAQSVITSCVRSSGAALSSNHNNSVSLNSIAKNEEPQVIANTTPVSHKVSSPVCLTPTTPAKDPVNSSSASSLSPSTPTLETRKEQHVSNSSSPSTPVRSLKHRILQDQMKNERFSKETKPVVEEKPLEIKEDPVSLSISTPITEEKRKPMPEESHAHPKKKVKMEISSEKITTKIEVKEEVGEVTPSNEVAQQPPVADYDQEMKLETVTATDILSQLINDSLLGTPHQEEVSVKRTPESKPEMKSTNSVSRHQRLPSNDQETVKTQMEVDQVLQDLAMLRQMSRGSPTVSEDSSPNKNSSGKLGNSSSPSDPFTHSEHSNQDKKSSSSSSSSHNISSYQNEFYKHLLQKDTNPLLPPLPSSSSPPPLSIDLPPPPLPVDLPPPLPPLPPQTPPTPPPPPPSLSPQLSPDLKPKNESSYKSDITNDITSSFSNKMLHHSQSSYNSPNLNNSSSMPYNKYSATHHKLPQQVPMTQSVLPSVIQLSPSTRMTTSPSSSSTTTSTSFYQQHQYYERHSRPESKEQQHYSKQHQQHHHHHHHHQSYHHRSSSSSSFFEKTPEYYSPYSKLHEKQSQHKKEQDDRQKKNDTGSNYDWSLGF